MFGLKKTKTTSTSTKKDQESVIDKTECFEVGVTMTRNGILLDQIPVKVRKQVNCSKDISDMYIENADKLTKQEAAKIAKAAQFAQKFEDIKTILENYGTIAFDQFKNKNINSLTIEIIDQTIEYIKNPTNSTNSAVFKHDKLADTLIFKLDELKNYMPTDKNYMPTELASGGAPPKPLKKSKESILISGKKYSIYLGPRSGKYIKKDKKYVSLSTLKKD